MNMKEIYNRTWEVLRGVMDLGGLDPDYVIRSFMDPDTLETILCYTDMKITPEMREQCEAELKRAEERYARLKKADEVRARCLGC